MATAAILDFRTNGA